MKTTEEKIQEAKDAEQKIEQALVQRGWKKWLAKAIAIGAVVIAGIVYAVTQTGCSGTYTRLPDGSMQATVTVVLPQSVETVTK